MVSWFATTPSSRRNICQQPCLSLALSSAVSLTGSINSRVPYWLYQQAYPLLALSTGMSLTGSIKRHVPYWLYKQACPLQALLTDMSLTGSIKRHIPYWLYQQICLLLALSIGMFLLTECVLIKACYSIFKSVVSFLFFLKTLRSEFL